MTHHEVPGQPYRGPNRRSGKDRRKVSNRREEFRFEPGKQERRSGRDRRKHEGWDDSLIR